jgi:hypothetical protein
LEVYEALGGGLFVSAPLLLPLGIGLFLLSHELLEGFLECQGAGLPGDVGIGSLVAWRLALPANRCQAFAFKGAYVWLLGINIDDITRGAIGTADGV